MLFCKYPSFVRFSLFLFNGWHSIPILQYYTSYHPPKAYVLLRNMNLLQEIGKYLGKHELILPQNMFFDDLQKWIELIISCFNLSVFYPIQISLENICNFYHLAFDQMVELYGHLYHLTYLTWIWSINFHLFCFRSLCKSNNSQALHG